MTLAQGGDKSVVIDSKLIYKGKSISSPRITTLIGQKAIISQKNESGERVFSLELRPLFNNGKNLQMGYSVMIGEAQNEIHSRGVVEIEGNRVKELSLNKGEVQIQLKVH